MVWFQNVKVNYVYSPKEKTKLIMLSRVAETKDNDKFVFRVMYEKYNALEVGKPGGGGEYGVQVSFDNKYRDSR